MFVFMYIIRKVAGTTILQLCVRAFLRGFECGSTGTANEEGIAFSVAPIVTKRLPFSQINVNLQRERERLTNYHGQYSRSHCVHVCACTLSPHLPVPWSSKVWLAIRVRPASLTSMC